MTEKGVKEKGTNSCQEFQMHYFTFKIFINVPFTNAHMMAVIEDSDSLPF